MSRVIETNLIKKISEIEQRYKNYIIVLKGIPLFLVGIEKPDLEKIIDGKFQYFSSMVKSNQTVISYEEFLLLHSFIMDQYNFVFVLENNQFMNLFPFYQQLDNDVFLRLRAKYDTNEITEQEEVLIGDLVKYSEVFAKCDDLDGLPLVAYTEAPVSDKDYKIQNILLFDDIPDNIEYTVLSDLQLDDGRQVLEVNDEMDYLRLVRMMMSDVDEITILSQNSELDSKSLIQRLSVLKNYFMEDVSLTFARLDRSLQQTNIYPECREILKKYWGDSKEFRTIKVYDINRLEQHDKQIVSVSQERIISDLISEAEKSKNGDFYRDLFVTAPTGSGKSAMFQIPAIYLAEKHKLMTIVISPLIGLMNDQIEGLNDRNYHYARTIHSDISPIVKKQIMEDIQEYRCHLLYISPETLLSRSDISQLIGERQLGLLVVDEAHIVTTWGKQFRPDYWFLGDYVSKLRQTRSFVIATFTATAIYGGIENMFVETKQSLRMVSPIVWLGYMRRADIDIQINEVAKITGKAEYELNKFDGLIKHIEHSVICGKKTLIYFPTVALIQRFYEYAELRPVGSYITRYHGQLLKTEKLDNYSEFKSGRKFIMLATKAFGMGIDIEDIEVVIHFAPTGNVCDYVQEIGRAARRKDITGKAIYEYMNNDFKHINRLHGLSSIRRTQLVQVIEKIYDLFTEKIRNSGFATITKRQNSMLIDAESFTYIFDGKMGDQDDAISKVKSAMLMIQKDFESRFGFSPFYVRPIPLFSQGYFQVSEFDQIKLNKLFPDKIHLVDKNSDICMIELGEIWEKKYKNEYSFPQFKYLIYTKDASLTLNQQVNLQAALCVDVKINQMAFDHYSLYFDSFKGIINNCVRKRQYYSVDELASLYQSRTNKSISFSKNVCEVMIAAMNVYKQYFSRRTTNNWLKGRELRSGEVHYSFEVGVDDFFYWIERGFRKVSDLNEDEKLYVVNLGKTDLCRELTTQLGVLETLDILSFTTLGGANSQLYIYVNQTQSLKRIKDKPTYYENKLLNLINDRHNLSVEMLTFLFSNKFTSETIWDYLEEYFLGMIPDEVKRKCEKDHKINFENL